MSLLSIDELRGFIPDTAETNATLQLRIDAVEQEIAERFGALTLTTDNPSVIAPITIVGHSGGLSLLPLPQRPDEIISVTDWANTDQAVLEPADFRIRDWWLERIGRRWGDRTVVVFRPVNSIAQCKRVIAQLVKLDMNWEPGASSQSAASWQQSTPSRPFPELREEILSTLGPPGPVFA